MSKTRNVVDEVAKHYGFENIKTPPIHINGIPSFRPEEKVSILKSYLSNNKNKEDNPVSMIYNNKPILTNNRICKKNLDKFDNFNLDIVGVKNSIAEAMIIQTSITALAEEGFKNLTIDINSIGDKDSFIIFKNELFNYYKDKIDELHPKCRNFNKKNIFNLLTCKHKECQSLKLDAPKSIYFLSESSQRHLKEVLEHLESIGITYRINNSLLSSDNFFSKVIFEIKSKEENQEEILLGRGGRYDELAKKITRKKDSSAVGISIEIKKVQQIKKLTCHEKKPEFYFVQLGPKAKLQSLPLMEILRQSGFPIKQNLYMSKLSEQIETARHLQVPYVIIMGQKEATENTVIIKDFRKASQETVETTNLVNYLKKLK